MILSVERKENPLITPPFKDFPPSHLHEGIVNGSSLTPWEGFITFLGPRRVVHKRHRGLMQNGRRRDLKWLLVRRPYLNSAVAPSETFPLSLSFSRKGQAFDIWKGSWLLVPRGWAMAKSTLTIECVHCMEREVVWRVRVVTTVITLDESEGTAIPNSLLSSSSLLHHLPPIVYTYKRYYSHC